MHFWTQEPFNGGCPVDYVTPGNMDAFGSIRDMHYGSVYDRAGGIR